MNLLTELEIENMRESGKRLIAVLTAVKAEIKPGVNLNHLEAVALRETEKQGGIPSFKGFRGYPSATCINVNEQIVHCIPDDYVLQEGDIVNVDFGMFYKGIHTDSAVTFPVGKVAPEVQRLLRGAYAALLAGTEQVKPGNYVNDISVAIEHATKVNQLTTFREFVGHGVGHQLHQEPMIPNYSNPTKGMKLVPNMAIAIEPIVGLGSSEVVTSDNGWNTYTKDGKPSAFFEHTILVTDSGHEIMTPIESLIGS